MSSTALRFDFFHYFVDIELGLVDLDKLRGGLRLALELNEVRLNGQSLHEFWAMATWLFPSRLSWIRFSLDSILNFYSISCLVRANRLYFGASSFGDLCNYEKLLFASLSTTSLWFPASAWLCMKWTPSTPFWMYFLNSELLCSDILLWVFSISSRILIL